VLDDGDVLIESGAILDWLDEQAGPAQALIPRQGLARRRALKVCALATGLGDKAVSLVYERVLHDQTSAVWQARCETQIAGVLEALEADRLERATEFWFGDLIGHPDIAVACVLRFLREAHPGVFDARRWPALDAHAGRCEGLPAFQVVVQAFHPPPR
jgi:glutathione S-transferase